MSSSNEYSQSGAAGSPLSQRNRIAPDSFDLFDVFGLLWRGKWIIGPIVILGAVASIIFALMLPNVYRATALVIPNQEEGAGSLSGLAAQYGGLASLAGINLQSVSTVDKATLGIEVLRSRKFISKFIDNHDLLVPLIAAKGWNEQTGELDIDPEVYDQASAQWIRKVSPPKTQVPSEQEAYKAFLDHLIVTQDKQTGFISISIDHYSPRVAKDWVDWLVADINASMMEEDVAVAQRAIKYLNEQIDSTSVSELRSVFYHLIEEQTKTIMLARVSTEYTFRTVDPAVVPELKARPKRSVIVIAATFFSGIVGVLALFIKNTIQIRASAPND